MQTAEEKIDPPLRGLFIAGSGTDVGKTVVTAALLRALLLAGINAQAVKPVQTGVAPEQANTATLADARVYAAAVEGMPQSAAMLPATALHCFSLPASPHLAAAREGAHLSCAGRQLSGWAEPHSAFNGCIAA